MRNRAGKAIHSNRGECVVCTLSPAFEKQGTFFRSSNKGGGVFAKSIEFETVATAAKFPTGTTYYLGYWELYFAILFGHCMLPCFSPTFLVQKNSLVTSVRTPEAALFLPLPSPTTVRTTRSPLKFVIQLTPLNPSQRRKSRGRQYFLIFFLDAPSPLTHFCRS